MTTSATEENDAYDVVVVGYGPVGAVLAGLLGQQGVRTLVVERDVEVYRLPRAVHLDGETVRIFQALGLADEVVASARPITAYEFVTAKRETLIRYDTPSGVTDDGFGSDYLFHQPSLERSLRATVAAAPSVEVELGSEVTHLEEGEAGVQERQQGVHPTVGVHGVKGSRR